MRYMSDFTRELEYLYITKYYSCGHLTCVPVRRDDYEMWKLIGDDRTMHTTLRCKLCESLTTKQELRRWEKEHRGEG